MSQLSKEQRMYLEERFGPRVSFNLTERMLYSHDIAAMPSLVKPLVGATKPYAIVQPDSEAELIELARWATANRIPIVPRGKASSGYGGVIPVKQGVVADFYRLKHVISLDKEAQTVTVEAGMVWEKLDQALKAQGFTLRLYPTSYPASTVGGWLAQGGAGIGSYEYGWFRDNVVSARVVLPSGQVEEFIGDDLDLIADAEGITGFISQVTLRIMPLENLDVVAIGCPHAHDLQKLIEAIVAAELPIWSLVFVNPKMAELKNRAPLMEHYGHPVEERVLLPASYVITIAFRVSDREEIWAKLPELLKPCEAEILSDRVAQHEWQHRFKLMVVKRLGPSLVPAEVVVPLEKLGDVMTEIERQVDQPIVKEGVIIRQGADDRPEVVILGFIPSDQRRFSYNFVFGLVLTIIKIAEKHGGRAYSTGLYFSKKAPQVLGQERTRRLKSFKARIDPQDIFNPGKVIGNGLLGTALNLASGFEPLIRPFGNYIVTQVGERPTEAVRDIPPDVAWYAYACSQCGYCIDECDQFYGRGWESQTPRGKWYWLREHMEGRADWDQFMVDTILSCTTCELCNLRCSAALPIEPSWMKLRGELIEERNVGATFPPFEIMAGALHKEGNIWAGYRGARSDWFPEDMRAKHGPGHQSKNIYFAGCTASYVEHDIGIASVRLLDAAGVDFTYLGEEENCCATPMLVAGKWELFAETLKKNVAAVKAAGADTVISSCPACDMMWRHAYPVWAEKLGIEYDVSAKHYSEIVSEKLASGEFSFPEMTLSWRKDEDGQEQPMRVTWHDSCHIGRVSGVYEPPRDLIKAVPGVEFVEMTHHHQEAHCCGSVLTLLKEPEVAHDVGKMRLEEATIVGAEKVLALCPCCEFQLRVSANKRDVPIEVIDLARFTAQYGLGLDLPDPNPAVREQWAVFEKMIALMTPEGFAGLMGDMLPELVDAMPVGMGPMMRGMGKVPGALNLIKPLLPVLFPRLLPAMMPKVMPRMLELVGERIPMPDYMAEQMPDLMPQVMDNLMPHMIGDVAPLVSDPLIHYLQGRNGHSQN